LSARRGNHPTNLEVRIPPTTISSFFNKDEIIADFPEFVNDFISKNPLFASRLFDSGDFPSPCIL